jgi:hypothetical protein
MSSEGLSQRIQRGVENVKQGIGNLWKMDQAASTGEVLVREFHEIHLGSIEKFDKDFEKKFRTTYQKTFPEETDAGKGKTIDKPSDTDLQKFYLEQVHGLNEKEKDPGQTALCLSGGGIRSAAFALGVMQGLARLGLLSKFHYLSTVSGGGYAGAWLTAWTTREAVSEKTIKLDFKGIQKNLANQGEAPAPLGELRKNQAFLTPKVGLVSPDTWAGLAIVVRNMLLNWLVFVPLLASFLLIPRLVQSLLLWWTYSTDGQVGSVLTALWDKLWDSSGRSATSVDPHTWLDGLGAFFVAFGICVAMVNRSKPDKHAIDDNGFGIWTVAPVVLGAFLLVAASCSWLANPDEKALEHIMLYQWIMGCALFFVVVRCIAYCVVRLFGERTEPSRLKVVVGEMIGQFLSGAFVGFLVWSGLNFRSSITNGDMTYLGDATVFGVPWFLMSFLAGQILLAGLTSHVDPKRGDRNREWWARMSGWFGAVALGWLGIFWLVIYGPRELEWANSEILAIFTAGSGVISLLGASPISGLLTDRLKPGQLSASRVITIASAIFIVCLAIWIAKVTTIALYDVTLVVSERMKGVQLDIVGQLQPLSLDKPLPPLHEKDSDLRASQRLLWTMAAMIALWIFSRLASKFVNVNYFSLNAMYRNRLVRAFLGASNILDVTGKEQCRNAFDGFAEGDNPVMHELRPGKDGPFHVVNITLNLTATENKAWQERKATSFICTPLHAGGDLIGYRDSKDYAGGITLGTAMSLSGAAASPNWGYHSSAVTSFIMTLFNVRLGAWLGNPNGTWWKKDGPRSGYKLFLQEALGRTTADQPFVYLSDGGHFENLGLYEMIRRRCHTIIVSDAGADPDCTLEDLGNAIRKIYIDLGVSIDFKRIDVRKRGPDPANPGVYCAVGRIRYPDEGAKEGRIVYIKPGLYDDAPADVRAYAAANAKFPHDSTLNQWFTESQFESYRALGAHAIVMIAGERDQSGNLIHAQPARPIDDLLDFCERAEDYLEGHQERTNGHAELRVVSSRMCVNCTLLSSS